MVRLGIFTLFVWGLGGGSDSEASPTDPSPAYWCVLHPTDRRSSLLFRLAESTNDLTSHGSQSQPFINEQSNGCMHEGGEVNGFHRFCLCFFLLLFGFFIFLKKENKKTNKL